MPSKTIIIPNLTKPCQDFPKVRQLVLPRKTDRQADRLPRRDSLPRRDRLIDWQLIPLSSTPPIPVKATPPTQTFDACAEFSYQEALNKWPITTAVVEETSLAVCGCCQRGRRRQLRRLRQMAWAIWEDVWVDGEGVFKGCAQLSLIGKIARGFYAKKMDVQWRLGTVCLYSSWNALP